MSLPTVLLYDPPQKFVPALDGLVEMLDWETAKNRRHDVEGILVNGHWPIDGKVMDQFPNLKVISNCGVGVDHIHVSDAKSRKILVGNTPGVLSEATADMAFTLLLAAGRRLIEGDQFARGPDFKVFDGSYPLGTEVHHTTIGIIGMGRIGFEVARRAIGFNMNVIYHNRSPKNFDDPFVKAEYVSRDQLLEESDYIVVVVPLNDETRNMISYSDFEKMKSSAVFINIARGGVVDTDAITHALQNNQIYAAGLDVTEPEPLPRDHPLLSMKNVTIAPHLGSATEQTRKAMFDLCVSNFSNGLNDQPIVSSV